jgi:hypothetical protein
MEDATLEDLVLKIQEKIDEEFGDHKEFWEKYNKEKDFTLFNEMGKICKPELTKLYNSKNKYIRDIRSFMYKIYPRIPLEDPDFDEDIWEDFGRYRFLKAILFFEKKQGKNFKEYVQQQIEWSCKDYKRKWKSSHPLTTLSIEEVGIDQLADERNHNSPETNRLFIDFWKELIVIINTINTKGSNSDLLEKILIYHCRKLCSEKRKASCIEMLKELQNKPLEIVVKLIEKEYNTWRAIDDSEHLFENLISRIHTEGKGRIFLDGINLDNNDNKRKINEWIREINEILKNTKNKEKIRKLQREYFDIITLNIENVMPGGNTLD